MSLGVFSNLSRASDAGHRRIQRACACAGKSAASGECESCKKKKLQRRASGLTSRASNGAVLAAPGLEVGGEIMGTRWRRELEPLFGVSFEGVRLHNDTSSHLAARSLQAHAFTYGQHVYFGQSQYRPESRDGLHLLAHELSHTIQQRGTSARADSDAIEVDGHDAPLERAADAHADAVLAGRATHVAPGSAACISARLIQRDAAPGAAAVELDRDNGDGTGVRIRRTLVNRDCTEVPETTTTPRDRIFEWDREANALKLNYSLCHGSVRLTAESSIDYSRVVDAGTRLLETLRDNPAAGADLPTLGRTAIDQATLSARGEVRLTVDGILSASVGAESTVGTAEQQVRVTGQLRITPEGVSFTITGFVDASRAPTLSAEQYSLNLRVGTRWFAVDLGYRVDERRPAGEAAISRGTLRIGAEIPLPDVGPLRDLTLRPSLEVEPRPGESPGLTPGLSLGGRFGGPDRTDRVRCYRCECPPPLPRYECTPYGSREVIDRQADTQRLSLLYQYDSNVPVDQAAFDGRIQATASMASNGYEVRAIRGYASPEGAVAYNQGLATRRAEHAHTALSQAMPAGSPALPVAEGVGELLGASSSRPGAEAANSELSRELVARLASLGPDERLNLLEVEATRRADPAQRQQALDDIQAFVDGRDARGRRLAGRARWERVFPFMRRVDVEVHLAQLAHTERVPRPDEAGRCSDEHRAAIDAEHPIPAESRLPQARCRS